MLTGGIRSGPDELIDSGTLPGAQAGIDLCRSPPKPFKPGDSAADARIIRRNRASIPPTGCHWDESFVHPSAVAKAKIALLSMTIVQDLDACYDVVKWS